MGGDYTRFTFDPAKAFSGVRQQQGRVSLDSDFNEFGEILDRHARAEMYDTVGQAVVPVTTAHGFEILVGPGGKLTIGAGRAYVDGILAECFGDMSDPATTVRDDTLGGVHGPGPVDYDKQPSFYQPGYPELSPTALDINLVYLDVWAREVTVREDPSLREPALNGPDTDTRVQTAWQVKVLQGADAGSCATPPPSWAALTAASTARLTAQATPTAPAPGPCVVNPVGGYTGLENRLYRVEVHQAGTLSGAGAAQFKWSRDNASLSASVISAITAISASESVITVSSTGRDSWMRFEHNDHIELLDDFVEFAMRETGTGGPMAKVLTVNHTTGEIHVDKDLSGFAVVGARHPRIRRWDIATPAESLVRPVNNGAPIALEEGITITFGGAASDTLHAGDYWEFAARTADGSIDPVVNQPPLGILHHFARLALVTSGAPPSVLTDCRVFWPPKAATGGEGCCTVVVHPGEDIQKAIDSLGPDGGCVCLRSGIHTIAAPLKIEKDDVTLHGEAPWVTVRRKEGGPQMLQLAPKGGRNVSVMGIRFEAPLGLTAQPMIDVVGVTGGRFAECALVVDDPVSPKVQAIGIRLSNCDDFTIESSWLRNLDRGVLGTACQGIRVLGNRMEGTSEATVGVVSAGTMGIEFGETADVTAVGIAIERNQLSDFRRGILLGLLVSGGTAGPGTTVVAPGCRIVGNTIVRRGSTVPGIFAIAAFVARCEILENSMNLQGSSDCGIIAAGGDAFVAWNRVDSAFTFGDVPPLLPCGVLAFVTGTNVLATTVQGNDFFGPQQAVVAAGTGTPSEFVNVLDNRVVGDEKLLEAVRKTVSPGTLPSATTIAAAGSIVLATVLSGRVAGNQVTFSPAGVVVQKCAVSVAGNQVSETAVGITVLESVGCEAFGNIVGSATSAGLVALGCESTIVRGNSFADADTGVAVWAGTGNRVADNVIHRGRVGIDLLAEFDADVRGNTVEEATEAGIRSVAALHRQAIAGNHVLRCGYHDANNPAPASGIWVAQTFAVVTINGCQVIDTGEAGLATGAVPPFTGRRDGIRVEGQGSARVSDCIVSSVPFLKPHPESRAILIDMAEDPSLPEGSAPPFADATDNVAEQAALILVWVAAIANPKTQSLGRAIFASNRCTNLFREGSMPPAVVVTTDGFAVVTGNQVFGPTDGPTLDIFAQAVSAVGNLTAQGANVFAGSQTPAPYATFNAIV